LDIITFSEQLTTRKYNGPEGMNLEFQMGRN